MHFHNYYYSKIFESITIRELTEKAGINRGTFYLHYVDKYDMFEQMKTEIVQELDSLLLKEAQ